jgi:hypothetical protein
MEEEGFDERAVASAENLYAIKSIPGRGQGLVATSRIHKGARILSEASIFKVPRDEPNLQVVESVIIKQLKSLDRDQQRAFFALHNAYGKRHSPFLGIARTNVLPLGSEAREGGLFLEASRINHSCRHNAQNTWNANIGCLTVHALRDIEEGQEITITYLSCTTPYAERQRFLQEKFIFDCKCELCSLLPAQREESDLRLSKIRSIDEAIGDLDEIISDPKIGLHLVHGMFRLFEEEGIWDASIPRAYYDAFQIAIANGDEARAKVFAERSYLAKTVIEGEDSPEAIRIKRLAERPAEHWLYGMSMESQQETNSRQQMDQDELEDWLWRENEWSKCSAAPNADDHWGISSIDPWTRNWQALTEEDVQELNDNEDSESFDSLSTDAIHAALFRSLRKA